MECHYVPLHISKKCLDAMWYLTFNTNEWGGQLVPTFKNGQCQLDCHNIELVKGTGLDHHTDEKYYKGENGTFGEIQIAVTPLYHQVFQKFPLCDTDQHVNMFFHTHPLLMGRVLKSHDHIGQFSPPSSGDIFAHTVLSNYRNWKENKQMNTPIVMAFEGMYMYTILPHKFYTLVQRIEQVLAELDDELTEDEVEDAAIGELPQRVIDVLKQEIFDELRPLCDAGTTQVDTFMATYGRARFGIKAATEVHAELWACGSTDGATCPAPVLPSLNFPFYRTIQDPTIRAFLQDGKNNVFLRGLNDHGFHYDFYPAPFPAAGVTLMAPTTLTPK